MKKVILFISFISLLSILTKAQQPYYNVTVHINAGELKDSITVKQRKLVQNLVVSGSMNYDDLALIQDSMPKLEYVNLRNVELDTIPKRAFYDNGSITDFILPLHIKYLDDYSFGKKTIWLEISGEYPQFGEEVGAKAISASPDNEYCKMIDYGIYSIDGKIMYHSEDYDLEIKVEEGTEIIASRAFEGIWTRRIFFPSTLLKIEQNVFKNMQINGYTGGHYSGPICMYFKSQNPPLLAKEVFGMDEYTSECHIWVPEGSRKLYQEADPQWGLFDIYEEGEPEPDDPDDINTISNNPLSVHMFESYVEVNSKKVISQVKVFGLFGNLVVSDDCNATNVTIPFNNMPKGIYLVRVSYENQKYETVKVIN